ncbi:tetratricopeptide repeat protein [Niabella sp. CJ426]|uniref:tetratricopeptide repeat protein n=1 Tax=Niabella sp. CJ426 TaxID=3393740 RepID=UPI003D04D835
MKNIAALWIMIILIQPTGVKGQNAYDRAQFQQLIQNQEYGQAIQILKTTPPTGFNKEYYLNLGYAYFMNDEEKNALPVYQTVHQHDPSDAPSNLYLAIIYQRMKKYTDALGFYKNLTQLQPDQYKYWFYTASMYSALDERDSAFTYTEKAYSLNPRAANVVLRYASGLAYKKEQKRAVAVIDSFLMADSSNEEIVVRKISYSARENKHKEVIFWGERLLKDSAIQPSAYISLAYAYLNTQKIDQCLVLCDWLELQGMKSEPTTYCAALCYAQKGDFVKSNLLLDECLKQNLLEEAKTYFRSKADNYEKTKDYKKAIAQYDSSYYIFQNPYDLYYKARVYDVNLNNKTQASVFYKKFLAVKQKPETPLEEKLFNYIKEYIKP